MPESQSAVDEILTTIRDASRRVTVPKRAVAEALAGANGHLTADAITVEVQRHHPEISPSTVYRILEEFEELKIVVHAHLGRPAAVYHLAGTVHGHLTCHVCNTTFEIPAAHFNTLSRDLKKSFGFQLDRHHVALSGTCTNCLASSRTEV